MNTIICLTETPVWHQGYIKHHLRNPGINITGSEAYPELKSNENYKQLMNELSITENMIAEYRSNFNKQVKQYNRYVRKFPTSILLNMTGYEKQAYSYLEYDVSEDAPQDLFGDK